RPAEAPAGALPETRRSPAERTPHRPAEAPAGALPEPRRSPGERTPHRAGATHTGKPTGRRLRAAPEPVPAHVLRDRFAAARVHRAAALRARDHVVAWEQLRGCPGMVDAVEAPRSGAAMAGSEEFARRLDEQDYLTDDVAATACFLAVRMGLPFFLESEVGVV